MATIYLGLGSNLGHREDNIRRAVDELKENGIEVHRISTIIETDPVGGPAQGKFLNAVIKGRTEVVPEELLAQLKSIEKKLGRSPSSVNGPRMIDIDILLYDQWQMETPHLTIPHPRMRERDFVMTPLREIAPELIKDLFHEDH